MSLIKNGKTKYVKMPLRHLCIDLLLDIELLGRRKPLEKSCEAFQSYSSD